MKFTIEKSVSWSQLDSLHVFQPVNFRCWTSVGFALKNCGVADLDDSAVWLDLNHGETSWSFVSFVDVESRFSWHCVTNAVLSNTLVRRVISASSNRLDSQKRNSVRLNDIVATLSSWDFLAIFSPIYRRLRVTTGSTEERRNTSNSNALVCWLLNDFRWI